IGLDAFYHCFGIRNPLYNSSVFAYMPDNYSGEYVIPSGIQTISGGAFWECRDLTSITIPESVTWIERYNFSRCSGLTSVTSWAKRPPICSRNMVFEDCDDVTLYVPYGSKTAYAEGEVWKTFSKIKEIAMVIAQANDETMGSVTGSGQYELDEQVKLEAIPNEGYHFEKWDDGNTDNPRLLTVTCDVVLTAMFAKDVPTPPAANESPLSAAPIAYVQGRTAYLSDGLGEVEAFTATGQRVYRGTDRTVTLPRPGIYVLRVVADGRRCKVVVK
ncbi:MAG: leucine-rich repeat protein, partial [Bacteroidales bacterium]|nr:leucine-rich repeat protein [Bacteroidales bacterium]